MKFINIYKTLDKIAYIQKKDKADISKSAVVIMCADNGISPQQYSGNCGKNSRRRIGVQPNGKSG